MEHDRDVTPDVDDTTVSVTSSLYDVQTLLNDDSDAHEDGHVVLREAVQVTSHGRVVSNAVHERPRHHPWGIGPRTGGGCRSGRKHGCRGGG